MENKNKKSLAAGIIAAGTLTGAALHELLLSKQEHDRKEREINKLEREKDKYMKKIGAYEPFDIEKGNVVANDSKLVNLLSRAVGVAFSNNDVFARNKSNIRTFPFIISNNSSISATMEVELRKYYELMVAAQVANMINHTVFAAENILNIKDSDMKSADKIVNKLFSRDENITDLGQSLQRGIYENFVMFEKDGKVLSFNESYADVYPGFDQFINDYENTIRNFAFSAGEKNKLILNLQEVKEKRDKVAAFRRNHTRLDYSLIPGETLSPTEDLTISNIKDFFNGKVARDFDDLESEDEVKRLRTNLFVEFDNIRNAKKDHKVAKWKDIEDAMENYWKMLNEYHVLLNRSLTVIKNSNFTEPSKDLVESDPYYRLLDLPRVDNYDKSSEMMMKMFRNSNTLKIKLEMAAALLISTEILPFEFIEYVTKYLMLPMHDKTKISIGLKYGTGTENNPLRFMGNYYVVSTDDKNKRNESILKFASAMRPSDYVESKELAKRLSLKQLKAGNFAYGIFDLFKNRQKLEDKWVRKHGDKIDARLASLYAASSKLDKSRKLRNVDQQITTQSKKIFDTAKTTAESLGDRIEKNNDLIFTKSLSLLGAGGNRVYKLIEDRLKNRIIDLYSVQDMDKSLAYFMTPEGSQSDFDPTSAFRPNLTQTQKLIQTILSEGMEDKVDVTILTEELILNLTEKSIQESYVYNLYKPVRSVTYKEVEKDPIEYILPAYTKGRSLLYGSTEIDPDQFKTRKVGEPIWIKVTFSDKINSMKSDVTDNDFTTVIGIKSEVHRVPEKEVNKVLVNPNSNIPDLAEIFKSQKAQTLGLLSKIANENDLKSASLNGILIVSINEATSNISSKPSDDYINNPKLAITLRKTYNLTSICLVDAVAEEYYIMEENSTSWSRLPFSELRASGNNSDIKALAAIMGGRR